MPAVFHRRFGRPLLVGQGIPVQKIPECHRDFRVQPRDFEILARSNVCDIEAMKHVHRPLYGVQWHPEVVHTEHGQKLLRNFIELCKK